MRTRLECPICNGINFQKHLSIKDYSVSQETFDLKACTTCGFLMTHPTPPNLDKYYQSTAYISHSSKPTTLLDKVYYQARTYTLSWKEKLLRKYTPTGSTNMLDYGCGTGDFIKHSQTKGWNACGVEPSSSARSIATANTNTKIAPYIQDIVSNDFDAITLWHVLEHVQDPNLIIAELKTRLHQNGTIFIAVPNHMSQDAQYYQNFWAAYDVPRHLWHFSQSTMLKLLQRHNLNLKSTIPMSLDAYYVSLLSEKYKSNGQQNLSTILRATTKGFASNQSARKTTEYSSLIYIATK